MFRSTQILTVLSRKMTSQPSSLGSYAMLNTTFHANFSSKTPKPTPKKVPCPNVNSNYEDEQTRLFGGIGKVSAPFDELAPSRPLTEHPCANNPEYEAEQTRLFGGIGRVSPPFDELAASRTFITDPDDPECEAEQVSFFGSINKVSPSFDELVSRRTAIDYYPAAKKIDPKPISSETNESTSPTNKF